MARLQCGHYIGSMIADTVDNIPRPLITPCVHLLFAYHFHEPEIIDVANDIHAQLVPYVLRVVTAFSYLIHVTIPCGIFAPLYSFMIDHRWTRSFSVFISTFSHMFTSLCEMLQTLHDHCIAPPGHSSFNTVLALYQNLIHDELRHLSHHYTFLFAQRAPIRGISLSFPDIHQSPYFTEEQIQSVYIPRLAPQRTNIDDVALFSTISSSYVGPDLTHFYRPDYTLHVLPDRNPRSDIPFTPPAQLQPSEPDTQAQTASTPHIEQAPLPQAIPPSPITIYSSSDTNMATAEGGSLADDSPHVITPQLGPLNSPPVAESSPATLPLPTIAETPTTETTVLTNASRPPPGFSQSSVTDAIRQTAREAVTQQLRNVTEQHTKASHELSQHIRTSQEQASKATQELAQQVQATSQQLQQMQQQVTQLCQTLAQPPKRSLMLPATYPPLEPPSRRAFPDLTRRSSYMTALPPADDFETIPPTLRDRPIASSPQSTTSTRPLTFAERAAANTPTSPQFYDAQETAPSSSTPALAQRLADALRDSREPRPLNLESFLNNPKPPKLTEEDMERFARKSMDDLTQAETYAFADQLEQYLTLDQSNPDLRDEARALRSLTQYMRWPTLAKWLKLYANPSSQFQYSKTAFWRHKYDNFAHECVPRSHRPPDLTESINRLTQTVINHLNPQQQQNNNRSNQNFRFRNNYNQSQNNQSQNQQGNQQSNQQQNQQSQNQQTPQQQQYRPNNNNNYNNNNNNGRPRPFNNNNQPRPFNNQNNQQPANQQQRTPNQQYQSNPQQQQQQQNNRFFQPNRQTPNNGNNSQQRQNNLATHCFALDQQDDQLPLDATLHSDLQNILDTHAIQENDYDQHHDQHDDTHFQ